MRISTYILMCLATRTLYILYFQERLVITSKKISRIFHIIINGCIVMDVEEMAKKATMKELKEIAKKHDIKLGRCPTKLKIAQLIPQEELEDLVSKK